MKNIFLIIFIVLLGIANAKNDKFTTKDIYYMAELSLKDLNLYLLEKGFSYLEGDENLSVYISQDKKSRISRFFKEKTLVYTFKNSEEYLNLTKQLEKDQFIAKKTENIEEGIKVHYEYDKLSEEIDQLFKFNEDKIKTDKNLNEQFKNYKIEIFNGSGIIKYYFAVTK